MKTFKLFQAVPVKTFKLLCAVPVVHMGVQFSTDLLSNDLRLSDWIPSWMKNASTSFIRFVGETLSSVWSMGGSGTHLAALTLLLSYGLWQIWPTTAVILVSEFLIDWATKTGLGSLQMEETNTVRVFTLKCGPMEITNYNRATSPAVDVFTDKREWMFRCWTKGVSYTYQIPCDAGQLPPLVETGAVLLRQQRGAAIELRRIRDLQEGLGHLRSRLRQRRGVERPLGDRLAQEGRLFRLIQEATGSVGQTTFWAHMEALAPSQEQKRVEQLVRLLDNRAIQIAMLSFEIGPLLIPWPQSEPVMPMKYLKMPMEQLLLLDFAETDPGEAMQGDLRNQTPEVPSHGRRYLRVLPQPRPEPTIKEWMIGPEGLIPVLEGHPVGYIRPGLLDDL